MPFLTNLLDWHVNVNVCFTVNIFMYLCKYLFKGPDQMMFKIHSENPNKVDEISDYINARYLSALEAAWRILQLNITERSPTIRSLSIHLLNRNLAQMVCKHSVQSTGSNLFRYFLHP